MATLVLTAIGDDQAGLVEALARVVVGHGGSWDRSQMATLAGKFAGIVEVSCPDAEVESFIADLEPLEQQGLLEVTVERADTEPRPTSAGVAEQYRLELVGQDQPGIVHEIATALAGRRISIEELSTAVESAAMAGGRLFRANALLSSPDSMDLDATRAALEEIADQLHVDIDLMAADSFD